MVKLNGISLKKVKHFQGHDECDYVMCDVYYNGKLLGHYSDDAWAGPSSFDLSEGFTDEDIDRIMKEFYEYFKEKEDTIKSLGFYEIEFAVQEILKIMEEEKFYKSMAKKGYETSVIVTDDYHLTGLGLKKTMADQLTDEEIFEKYKENIDKMKENMFKNKEIKVTIYRSKEDFDIKFK